MQSLTVFALLLEIVPALAGVSPFARRSQSQQQEREWTPARETPAPTPGLADGGLSPAPTARPHGGDFGEMELFKRYQMGTDTCGFASGYKSEPWTCYKVGASCIHTGSFLGCCVGTTPDCYSTVLTTCIPFTQGQTTPTSCSPGSICCGSLSPSCWTWQFSTSTAPDATFSAFNCYPTGGTGTLLDTPPGQTATNSGDNSLTDSVTNNLNPSTTSSSSTSSTGSSSSSTTTTTAGAGAAGANSGSSGDSSSAPVGAIVGGVIGGLAVIGTAVVVIFWLVYRQRRQAGAAAGTSEKPGGAGGGAAAGMQQYPPSTIGSPNLDNSQQQHFYGAAAAGGYPQQHPSPPPGAPQQQQMPYPGYNGHYDPAKQPQQQHMAQYSPSAATGVVMQPQYTGHSEGAWSGAGGSPSPAPTGPVSELGVHNPAGSQGNRAELG